MGFGLIAQVLIYKGSDVKMPGDGIAGVFDCYELVSITTPHCSFEVKLRVYMYSQT